MLLLGQEIGRASAVLNLRADVLADVTSGCLWSLAVTLFYSRTLFNMPISAKVEASEMATRSQSKRLTDGEA